MYKKLSITILCFWCAFFTVVYFEKYSTGKELASASTSVYEKKVAITFDDGPGRYTKKLLDELKKRNVRASFFLIGENIEKYRDDVARMKEDGHLIGNHTLSHTNLCRCDLVIAKNEVDMTNQKICDITGEMPRYLRPPCGAYNDRLLRSIDMQFVLWTVDTDDWKTHSVSMIVNEVMKNVKDGDIILFHDIYDTSVVAAVEIVDRLLRQGYKFVTVDELIIE